MLWDVGTQKPYVALSFDDGPDPRWTPRVLDALRDAGFTATFFLMGYNVDHHRELAHRVLDEGHDIGNHTWSHQDLAFQDPASTREEIVGGHRAIKEILGVDTTWFRPPRGELSGAGLRILAEENYDTFLWSVSRNVPGVGTPEVVAQHIVERLRPGAIVDMHDSIGRGLFLPHRTASSRRSRPKRRGRRGGAGDPRGRDGRRAEFDHVDAARRWADAGGAHAGHPGGPELSQGPTTVPPGPRRPDGQRRRSSPSPNMRAARVSSAQTTWSRASSLARSSPASGHPGSTPSPDPPMSG